jgi:predicted component of type VI protein secretion system
MAHFVIQDAGGTRQVPIGRLLTIGRSHNNDLVLSSIFASRRHAWVWRQADQFILEDLGSTHGTYINGQRLTRPRFLNHRDLVTMGEARLTFIAGRDPSQERTPPRGQPQLAAGQLFCPACGAPNASGSPLCDNCGSSLSQPEASIPSWENDHIRTSRPITPSEPVVARPFPTLSAQSRGGLDRRIWLLILLLALLAASLVAIVAMLLIYVLF